MKNQFSNLGKALNQAEQKQISGGYDPKIRCGEYNEDCSGYCYQDRCYPL